MAGANDILLFESINGGERPKAGDARNRSVGDEERLTPSCVEKPDSCTVGRKPGRPSDCPGLCGVRILGSIQRLAKT